MSNKHEHIDETQSLDMEVSIQDHEHHVMSRSQRKQEPSALTSTEGGMPEIRSFSMSSNQETRSTNSCRQDEMSSASQVAHAPSRSSPTGIDEADKINPRAKVTGTKRLWVGKPRRNHFVLGVIGGVLTIAVVAVLWYLEYIVFKKPIDKSALVYSSCGDCHCIPDTEDQSCPADPQNEDSSSIFVNLQLSSMTLLNPSTILCDPYTVDGTGVLYTSCIDKTEGVFWDEPTSVCAFVYDLSANKTDDGCPITYSAWTFPGEDEANAEGAVVTHTGGKAAPTRNV
jgi:hypothetical protein